MKKIPMSIETFEEKGFYIDILSFKHIDYGECYEAWIYDPHCGTKFLMFGAPAYQQTYDEFMDVVVANIDVSIVDYKNENWYEEE